MESVVLANNGGGATPVLLAWDGAVIGMITVADRPREAARDVIDLLRGHGVRHVTMLTGDNAGAAAAVASELGLTDHRPELLPHDKVEAIRELKTRYGTIAMVGDGVNDAPALAAADVSFAIGAGADVAIKAADVTLMRDDLMSVVDAITLSRATVRKIRQNLFFAFFYNALGIPLAAVGLLNPVIAGGAMALSSVSVVSNSLMLKRWKPARSIEKWKPSPSTSKA
jgi:Cu+-exporting ATPase